MKTKHNIKYSGLWFILFLVLAYRDSARATQGYEVSGYFVYSVFAGTGDPVYKEERLFYVKVGFPEWLIRTEPLEEKKNGVGYWEVCNTTNGEIIALTGLAAAYDPDKSPLKSIRATVKELEETNLGFNSKTPIFHPNSSSGSNTNHLDNVAVARHFIGNIPPADSSFASFLWFAYTKQTGLKGTSTEGDLLPQIWDSGKPVDHQMHHVVWSNFENAPYLIKSALFKWSGVDSQTDGSEIKLGSSINSCRCNLLSVNCLSSICLCPIGARRSEGERSEPSAAESRWGRGAPRVKNWSRAGQNGFLLGCRKHIQHPHPNDPPQPS